MRKRVVTQETGMKMKILFLDLEEEKTLDPLNWSFKSQQNTHKSTVLKSTDFNNSKCNKRIPNWKHSDMSYMTNSSKHMQVSVSNTRHG